MPVTVYLHGHQPRCLNVMLPTTWLLWKLKRFLRKGSTTGGPPPIGIQRKTGWRHPLAEMKSLVRISNVIAEEWFRHFVCWIAQRQSMTVIMDRHFFFDYFAFDVQPHYGPRNLAGRIHGWMLRRLYPTPDFVIFLDADTEVLFRRKPEGTIEQLQRRRTEYLDAKVLFPNSVSIDVDRPLEGIVQLAIDSIADFRSGKTQPLVLNSAA